MPYTNAEWLEWLDAVGPSGFRKILKESVAKRRGLAARIERPTVPLPAVCRLQAAAPLRPQHSWEKAILAAKSGFFSIAVPPRREPLVIWAASCKYQIWGYMPFRLAAGHFRIVTEGLIEVVRPISECLSGWHILADAEVHVLDMVRAGVC